MKTDCFAFKNTNRCAALTELVCKKSECKFYKTEEQFQKERVKYPVRGDLS